MIPKVDRDMFARANSEGCAGRFVNGDVHAEVF